MSLVENLPSCWRPSNGRFDDGIAETSHPEGEKPPSKGTNFRKLMEIHGVTEEEVADKKIICCDCKKPHTRRAVRCLECEKKRKLSRKLKNRETYKQKAETQKPENLSSKEYGAMIAARWS